MDVKFVGIDDWNRPCFKSTKSKLFFGSLDKLFPWGTPEEKVLETVTEEDLLYFGREFDCEPYGANPPKDITIVRSEHA